MERGSYVAMVSMIFSCIGLLFVMFRLYTRIFMVRLMGPDDWLMASAVVFSFGLSATSEIQRQNGLGQHIQNVDPAKLVIMFKAFFASTYMYNMGVTVSKGSIMIQFLRFMTDGPWRIATLTLLIFATTWSVVMMIAMALICQPINYFWDRSIPGKCGNTQVLWFMGASIAIFTDIAICILPFPILGSLHLPRKQKYSLVGVFALGGFGCITAILRLASLYTATHSTDLTYANANAAMWSAIELNTCIVCGCLPTLRPLIMSLWPKLLQRTTGETRSGPPTHSGDISRLSRMPRPLPTAAGSKMPNSSTTKTTPVSEEELELFNVPPGMFGNDHEKDETKEANTVQEVV